MKNASFVGSKRLVQDAREQLMQGAFGTDHNDCHPILTALSEIVSGPISSFFYQESIESDPIDLLIRQFYVARDLLTSAQITTHGRYKRI